MRFRNTLQLLAVAALPLAATPLAAQYGSSSKPATSQQRTTPTRSTATKQQAASTSAAAQTAISSDSARKIALTNMPGATVKSEKLGRNGGKRAYMFTLTANGRSSRAAVDAESGAFTQVAPHSARANRMHGTANKKPSQR